jgi:hypothetical protein
MRNAGRGRATGRGRAVPCTKRELLYTVAQAQACLRTGAGHVRYDAERAARTGCGVASATPATSWARPSWRSGSTERREARANWCSRATWASRAGRSLRDATPIDAGRCAGGRIHLREPPASTVARHDRRTGAGRRPDTLTAQAATSSSRPLRWAARRSCCSPAGRPVPAGTPAIPCRCSSTRRWPTACHTRSPRAILEYLDEESRAMLSLRSGASGGPHCCTSRRASRSPWR